MLDEPIQKTTIAADDWCRGRVDAPIPIVEYGDFECQYCGAAFPALKALLGEFPDTMRLIYRHFPVANTHPNSELAAEAAEAAGAQGKFWAMHDVLFRYQQELELADLHTYAKAIGLDLERFDREMSEHTYAPKVQEDIRTAAQDGVQGTPTLFINGMRYDGPRDYPSLLATVLALGAGAA